jgi:hypothetical protein
VDPGSVNQLVADLAGVNRRKSGRPTRAGFFNRGWSYEQVRKVVRGRAGVSQALRRDLAIVLGVTEAWLASGSGPKTEEAARIVASQDAMVRTGTKLRFDPKCVDALMDLPGLHPEQRDALLTYSLLLARLDRNRNPDPDLLLAAARYLLAAERAVIEACDGGRKGPLARVGSRVPQLVRLNPAMEPGHYAAWADAVLSSFSLNVKGLGR